MSKEVRCSRYFGYPMMLSFQLYRSSGRLNMQDGSVFKGRERPNGWMSKIVEQ